MRTSDNYGLKLVEGTDLVNPLIQDVPNYETIDETMYENACNSIPLATELKSGTVHALTRSNPDAPMFRFIATSRYDEGDTFTVDGIQVSGLLTDGTTLSDGAYVINANVLCCLVGTVLTLFTVPGTIQTAQNALKLGGELPSYYGTASDVQTATNTANAAGLLSNSAMELARQTNSSLTALEALDFTETTIPSGTSFNSVVQQLMNKVFPKEYKYKITSTGTTATTYGARVGIYANSSTETSFVIVSGPYGTVQSGWNDGNIEVTYVSGTYNLKAFRTITLNDVVYPAGATIKSWSYTTAVDDTYILAQ